MPAITQLIWNICSENLASFLSSSCWMKGFQALQRKKSISFTSTRWIYSVVFPVHSFGRRCTVSNLRKGLHRGKSRWTKADLYGPKLAQKTDMMQKEQSLKLHKFVFYSKLVHIFRLEVPASFISIQILTFRPSRNVNVFAYSRRLILREAVRVNLVFSIKKDW